MICTFYLYYSSEFVLPAEAHVKARNPSPGQRIGEHGYVQKGKQQNWWQEIQWGGKALWNDHLEPVGFFISWTSWFCLLPCYAGYATDMPKRVFWECYAGCLLCIVATVPWGVRGIQKSGAVIVDVRTSWTRTSAEIAKTMSLVEKMSCSCDFVPTSFCQTMLMDAEEEEVTPPKETVQKFIKDNGILSNILCSFVFWDLKAPQIGLKLSTRMPVLQ